MDDGDGVSQRCQVSLVGGFVARLWGFDLSSAGLFSETLWYPNFLTSQKGQGILTYHITGIGRLNPIGLRGGGTVPGMFFPRHS